MSPNMQSTRHSTAASYRAARKRDKEMGRGGRRGDGSLDCQGNDTVPMSDHTKVCDTKAHLNGHLASTTEDDGKEHEEMESTHGWLAKGRTTKPKKSAKETETRLLRALRKRGVTLPGPGPSKPIPHPSISCLTYALHTELDDAPLHPRLKRGSDPEEQEHDQREVPSILIPLIDAGVFKFHKDIYSDDLEPRGYIPEAWKGILKRGSPEDD